MFLSGSFVCWSLFGLYFFYNCEPFRPNFRTILVEQMIIKNVLLFHLNYLKDFWTYWENIMESIHYIGSFVSAKRDSVTKFPPVFFTISNPSKPYYAYVIKHFQNVFDFKNIRMCKNQTYRFKFSTRFFFSSVCILTHVLNVITVCRQIQFYM